MKVGPSIPLAGFGSEVGRQSPFEKYRASVEIETTPDERRVLNLTLANFEWAHLPRGTRNIGSLSTIS
jgi:hypothetical protein